MSARKAAGAAEKPPKATDAPEPAETPEEPEAAEGPAQGVEKGEIEDFKPSGADLVATTEEEVFAVLDAHDEAQILDELQGRLLEVYFYDFAEGGRRTVGPSYKLVRDATGLMNRTGKCQIGIVPGQLVVTETIEDDEPHYVADVWAQDRISGQVYSGTSTEPKRMKLKSDTAARWRSKGKKVPEDNKVWDPFARTKAINKAERNALLKFIPQQIVQTLIAQYLGDESKVKRIGMGESAEKVADLPAPLEDERAQASRAKAEAVYDEVKELPGGRVRLPPAAYFEYLMRSQHDHDRLDAFVEFLESVRDELKEAAA